MECDFKILFLDDDQFSHWNLGFALEQKEYPFFFEKEYCPLVAIDKFRNKKFDCIITDFNMPHLNGREFIHEIYKIDPHLPPIIGYSGEENALEVFGDNSRLIKVFDKNKLSDCLDFIMDQIYSGVIQ